MPWKGSGRDRADSERRIAGPPGPRTAASAEARRRDRADSERGSQGRQARGPQRARRRGGVTEPTASGGSQGRQAGAGVPAETWSEAERLRGVAGPERARRRADMNVVARLFAKLPRPLDPVRSIKLKLGLLVCFSGAIGLGYFAYMMGWIPPGTSVIAIGLALATTYILAHGMTRPLREMTAAARAMARGDYS